MHADTGDSHSPVESDRLIDAREFQVLLGVGHSKFYSMLRDPQEKMPRPVRYSARMVRFSRNAALRYVAARVAAAQTKDPSS